MPASLPKGDLMWKSLKLGKVVFNALSEKLGLHLKKSNFPGQVNINIAAFLTDTIKHFL